MKKMVVVYIICKDYKEAEKIGNTLLEKKLAACINIFPEMKSASLWPPKSGQIERAQESVLLAKTVKEKLMDLEKEVLKMHSYDTPAIIAFETEATEKYADWVISELI